MLQALNACLCPRWQDVCFVTPCVAVIANLCYLALALVLNVGLVMPWP
jgi:hypothetical protein